MTNKHFRSISDECVKQHSCPGLQDSPEKCFLVSFCGLTAYHPQMVMDWMALNDLIGVPAANSSLIYADSIGQGFPRGDRINLTSQRLEYVESTLSNLESRFSMITGDRADDLNSDETLFIVLVGHGRGQDGALVLDEEDNILVEVDDVEVAVEDTKGSIVLVNLACHSGWWTSTEWTLVTGDVLETMHSNCFPPLPIPAPRPFLQATEDQLELESLVAYHLRFLPPSLATETTTTCRCNEFLRGRLDPYEKAELLLVLRLRKHQLVLAGHIAEGLGWSKFKDPYGPGMQDLSFNQNVLMPEADAAGCMVSTLRAETFGLDWKGAASWLAETWNAHGRPTIGRQEWDTVLARSRRLMEEKVIHVAVA